MNRILILMAVLLLIGPVSARSQNTEFFKVAGDTKLKGLFHPESGTATKTHEVPLFSFRLGELLVSSYDFQTEFSSQVTVGNYQGIIRAEFKTTGMLKGVLRGEIKLINTGTDTLEIWNLLPFGESPERVYITGLGRHRLSRTHLFRPGQKPVNVIVPDNAWNLGYADIQTDKGNLCALTRRSSHDKAQISRFENRLLPGGSVTYNFFVDTYEGKWQEGVRKMFQEHMLFDLEEFDNRLYEREDLKWIRHTYVSHLLYAWDHQYLDSHTQESTLEAFIQRGLKWYGGDDFIGIWPTWPSLGLDQRNQWDLFRDMPGGLDELRRVAEICRTYNSRFFICYNPWDEDTRAESHFSGMADMIRQIGADGVVLDTRGSSSIEIQQAADSVRTGVVMYSEGMAVVEDMPGIVSGRVHNALYFPPLLNLNKLIKPDFAIFRVAELAFEPIRREYATSFFNGYGTELNIFKPGRPYWIEDDYRFFGKTVRILRESTSNFVQYDFDPLIPVRQEDIYVNKWPLGEKVVYTIFSLVPQGFQGPLFLAEPAEGSHWVDVWNHQEVEPVSIDGDWWIPVETDAFSAKWLGTNNEGAVGAVIRFKEHLQVHLNVDLLTISQSGGDEIRIWAGAPDYEKQALILPPEPTEINLTREFGFYEGKFIVQLFRNKEIIDQRIVEIKPGTPRLISESPKTRKYSRAPEGMVDIPAGLFTWKTTQGDEFIGYPINPYSGAIQMPAYFMDKYPVTNRQFELFVRKSGYLPADTVNYLKHWLNGKPLSVELDHPVVYVSYEDAKAYANWAGLRLPNELEWQYAAQTSDQRPWPWGSDEGVSREEQWVTNTLTVKKIKGIDPGLCNVGSGKSERVGSYPKGANPFGLEDLVGCVWQLTGDEYDNGSNRYVIMKGGSFFNPGSSWWYVQGGPRELHYRQMLLRVSRGFERNSTVGFRCIADKK